jgi:hypothetical protein
MTSIGDLSLSGQNLQVFIAGGNIGIGDLVRITVFGNAPTNNRLVTGIHVNSAPRGVTSAITIITSNEGRFPPSALTRL